MRIRKAAWAYALGYTCLSLGIEALLIVVAPLRVPDDNAVIAPVILTIPPVLAAWISGYRAPKPFLFLVRFTVVLTLVITIGFGRLTGVSTGLEAPIFVRSMAGFLAVEITNKIVAKRRNEKAENTDPAQADS